MINYSPNEMVTLSVSRTGVTGLTARLTILLFVLLFSSCIRDFSGEDTPNLPGNDPIVGIESTTDGALLVYFKDKTYNSRQAYSALGSLISSNDVNINWNRIGSVNVGKRQFVVSHNDDENFGINLVNNRGQVAQQTQSGTWANNYETFFGFHVGDRGFIFGQDSYGSHRWFTQEVLSNGQLAANESDHGSWNNFYGTATPIYHDSKTYLFFQTDDADNYWFIASVSPDGVLTDVDDGYWNFYWRFLTSVEVRKTGGGTYLIGMRYDASQSRNEFFIQLIYFDGKMGPETERIHLDGAYDKLVGYESGGHTYILAYQHANGKYIIREIMAGGKSVQVSSGTLDVGYDCMVAFSPFSFSDPGSFRYSVGWDLRNASGNAVRWSEMYSQPWSGEIEFGGGAALTQIDNDYDNYPEAVFVGIDDVWGANNKFYYKIGWNLLAERDGRAQTWSKAYFSPPINDVPAGAGADVADIDGNGRPDLLLMYIDDPDGVNQFRYHIGWNLSATSGQAASWSSMMVGPNIGNSNQGGGAALGDIDKNGRPDLVLMGVDNPEKGNAFRYCVGKNLDKTGKPTSWTPVIQAPCYLGWSNAGGGASLADINGNGKLDLVLSGIDSPSGANNFWCYIGWDIDINGNVTSWSPKFVGPAVGYITEGGGTAVGDIDHNGKMDILLMGLDNPYGVD